MKSIKEFNGFKLMLDDQGSGNERMLLKMDNPVADYTAAGFDVGAGGTVIDIGAHIGRFCIYAATKAKAVYAYEPDPANVAKLVENIKLNNLQNVYYFENVVNSNGATATLYLSDSSSENSLYKGEGKSIQVPGVTLENIFVSNNIESCNFLKMDCEGAEYEILGSLPAAYFKKIDQIALEYHDHLYKDKSLKDLVYILAKNGFKVWVKRGAWYTGILYAKKAKHSFLISYFRVYVIDLVSFCFQLVMKKLKISK